jgi:hypothetical protein
MHSGLLDREEAERRLRRMMRMHEKPNELMLTRLFYDATKLAHCALKRKTEDLRIRRRRLIKLRRAEITRLLRLIHYHYSCTPSFEVRRDHDLSQCFGWDFTETNALKFFEEFVEGTIIDRQGLRIQIDLDGMKFMYKDKQTGEHKVSSEHYSQIRGKRLPWIRHTIQKSAAIYHRFEDDDVEIMYVAEYRVPIDGDKFEPNHWIVIVRKLRKDQASPFRFTTAFLIMPRKYNSLIRRLERYEPGPPPGKK